ncbi:MAG: YybH family protein [Thermoguttaceae bacterium]
MSCRRLLAASVVLAALAIAPSGVYAAQPSSAELTEIRAAAAAYVKALEAGDTQALAAAWTADGDYVDAAGRSFKARDLIASQFREGAGGRSLPKRVTVDQVRLIAPEVAIEDGHVVHAAASGEPARRSRYSAVWVKQGGGWRLDSLRESALPSPPRNPRLNDLAWLLGEFAGLAADGTQVVLSGTVSSDGNYLLREVIVTDPDHSVRSFRQRIGWDPLSGGLKSWTFDSDGGYSEGLWKRQGDSWIVNTSGVSPDGKRSSATSIHSQINDKGFVFESVGATVDGKLCPDAKVKLLRQAPQE